MYSYILHASLGDTIAIAQRSGRMQLPDLADVMFCSASRGGLLDAHPR